MKRVTKLCIRLFWTNWRFLLGIVGLVLLFVWYSNQSMPPVSYSAFMNLYDGNASVSGTALAFGLENPKQYADMDEVYQAYISRNTPFFYQKAITNGGAAVFFVAMVLSLWVVNHSMNGSVCRVLLQQGCRRIPVCVGLLFSYLLAVLLCCVGGFGILLLTRPIEYGLLPQEYIRQTLLCWVLFIIEAAALLAIPAFTLKMVWAILADLALLIVLSIVRPLRALVSPAVISAAELWDAEGFSLHQSGAVPVAFGVIAVSLLAMGWVFRQKDFSS